MAEASSRETFERAVQCHRAGRFREAEALYRQVISQQPNHFEAYNNLGLILKDRELLAEAIAVYRQAIVSKADYVDAYSNLGNALYRNGQVEEAIATYRAAIALEPGRAEVHNNLGVALKAQARLDEALQAFRQVVALKPNLPEAYVNLGNTLRSRSELDRAIEAYQKAIALNPRLPEGFTNLGIALADVGMHEQAIGAFRQALALRPGDATAHSYLIFTMHYDPAFDAKAIAGELSRWNLLHAESLRPATTTYGNDPAPDRRLRIGFVSADFRDHVVGQCLTPLLRERDRERFEVTCYAGVLVPDGVTGQMQQLADRWRNIVGVSDEHVAEQIRQDGIDILVDLALHTGSRLLVFARRPAPVQVSFLGYCGSTGMTAMDYRLSDPHLDPPGGEDDYVEKTVRLAQSYWCYQPKGAAPEVAPLPARAAGYVTFGCMNNFAKVSTDALSLWGRILGNVPGSRIVIHCVQGSQRERTLRRLAECGVNADRIHFFADSPWAGYIARYGMIDIALDPFPYGGGVTTCDALWMGVPVVTLCGRTAVGRGGQSILSNIGLSELIALTGNQYVEIATKLAGELDRLEALRREMRARMLASPLMDARGYARDVEAAFRLMWQNWCESTATPRA